MCLCLFCCGDGCYDGDSTWVLEGLLPPHSLVIWSLGHREIADNLDENGWKIAVFRPLLLAPLFFSYFLFYFSLPHPPHKKTLEAEGQPARPARIFPVSDVFCKQTCKVIQNLTTLRQSGWKTREGEKGSMWKPGLTEMLEEMFVLLNWVSDWMWVNMETFPFFANCSKISLLTCLSIQLIIENIIVSASFKNILRKLSY